MAYYCKKCKVYSRKGNKRSHVCPAGRLRFIREYRKMIREKRIPSGGTEIVGRNLWLEWL